MKMLAPLLLIALAGPAAAEPPQRRSEQRDAWEARREGRLLPRREIEARVIPTMKGADYLGFTFDMASAVYTLKFLRDGAVIWVDVDGRSGQIIGRTR
jgi:hypothetical protein